MSAAKDGRAHLESLRDDRELFLSGERVSDVTEHPAYRNSVASAAYLYDHLAPRVVTTPTQYASRMRW